MKWRMTISERTGTRVQGPTVECNVYLDAGQWGWGASLFFLIFCFITMPERLYLFTSS